MAILLQPREHFIVKGAVLKLIVGLTDYSSGNLEFLETHDLEKIYREVILEDLKLAERY